MEACSVAELQDDASHNLIHLYIDIPNIPSFRPAACPSVRCCSEIYQNLGERAFNCDSAKLGRWSSVPE
jgi:hypothetical protein